MNRPNNIQAPTNRKSVFLTIASLFLLILFASCEKEIEFNGEITKPCLVVNSILTPDSLVAAYVTESRFFLDDETSFTEVKNAEVQVFVNGVFKENMAHQGNGYYQASFTPKEGDKIRLVVSASGYTSVSSETDVQTKTTILQVDTIVTTETKSYHSIYTTQKNDGQVITVDTLISEIYKVYNFTVKFKDPQVEKNYYRIKVREKRTFSNGTINYENKYINFTDIVSGNQSNSEEDFMDTGTTSNEENLFSDDLFNGKDYSLKFKYEYLTPTWYKNYDYLGEGITLEKIELDVDLQRISKDYYLYLKTKTAAVYGDPMFTEPVQIYNNIVDGMGILGSYSSSSFRMDLPFTLKEVYY